MKYRTVAIALLALVAGAAKSRQAAAEDAFYDLVISDLDLAGQKIPQIDTSRFNFGRSLRVPEPYASLDVPGEVYLTWPMIGSFPAITHEPEKLMVVIRAAADADVKGTLYVPSADRKGLVPISFSLPRSAAKPDANTNFYAVKLKHFDALVQRQIPGGAWFRHEFLMARQAIDGRRALQTGQLLARSRSGSVDNLSDAVDYLTGSRAMSENLQLDRLLRVADHTKAEADTETVADIKGITIAEIDWSKLTAGLDPKLDALATVIPADQHVVFFPTFDHFVRIIDEGMANGTPVLEIAEPRAEDARTLERYQRQLCLSLSGIGRLVGPKVVKSIALTGSDPFYRTGTDMAIVFEAADPAGLEKLLLAQISLAAASDKQVKSVDGRAGQLQYHGLRTPDRSICSFVAKLPNAVVVTNSTYQLERLSSVSAAQNPAVASLAEFKFFRSRYKLGDAEETAFVFVSDATIRRWCGPRWRIAESRRMRDLAVMTELQATFLSQIVKGESKAEPLPSEFVLATGGQLRLTSTGVSSSTLGNLDFQTPIAEMPLDRVTQSEAAAYRNWREGYERNWRWAFDPIGLRIGLSADKMAADLTVMPLIAGTQYRQFLSITEGATIHPGAVDSHDALAQLVLAINPKCAMLQQLNGMAQVFAPEARIDFLSWLGGTVSVYLDDDPLWKDFAETDPVDRERFINTNWHRLPLAVQIEVSNPLKLTGFLLAVRTFIDKTSPNMLEWETLEYRGQGYVKVSPALRLRGDERIRDAGIFYCPSGTALIVTPNEAVLKRAIDRQLALDEATKPAENVQAATRLIGGNLAVHVDSRVVDILSALGGEQYQATMQRLAWGNLPILNEWHQLYPDIDPVTLHERIWRTRLVCPGGGKYVWNERFRTMESTVYGHPGEPKEGAAAPPQLRQFTGADFGLTFENQGLRARMSLDRTRPKDPKAAK